MELGIKHLQVAMMYLGRSSAAGLWMTCRFRVKRKGSKKRIGWFFFELLTDGKQKQ